MVNRLNDVINMNEMNNVILKFDIIEPNNYMAEYPERDDWYCRNCERSVKKEDTLIIDSGIFCRECITKKLEGWIIDWKNLVYWQTISRKDYEKEFESLKDVSINFGKIYYCLNCGAEHSIYMTEYCVGCGASLDIRNNTYGKFVVKREGNYLRTIDNFGNE